MLRLGEELGRGAYGQVYRGMDTRTGQHVAIKQISLERIPADSLQSIMNEVELLKGLNHKNIVKYLGSFRTKTHLYIILEFMENGALSSIIKQNKFGPFPEALVAVYTQQVLQGLAYLHDQGVVHRDIKGANILTTKDGLVKLADFGVAAKLGELEADNRAGREASPVGTPYWMAPEVVELKAVTTAADIWSVGCLAIELLTGNPPYYDLQPMSALYNIVQDLHPPLPPNISMGMQDFLVKCFQKDAARRPSARRLLQHSWITYNRRTLRSSWSRTRGMKARGARTDAHTTVSTVVERMLQAEADDSDTVPSSEQQGGQPSSPQKPPPLPMTPQQEQTVAGITHQLAHSLRLSTPSLASPGRAAHSPSASTLGPLARASQFHTNNVGAPTTSPATSAAAAPVHVASDSASSALAAPATTSSSSAKAELPGPSSDQQSLEGPLASADRSTFSPHLQQQTQQKQPPGTPPAGTAPPAHQLQLQGSRPTAQISKVLSYQLQPGQAAGVAHAVQTDGSGNTLLDSLEARCDGGRDGALTSWPSLSSREDVLLAAAASSEDAELDASARQAVVEVQRQVASMRSTPVGERNMVQEAAAAASARALIGYLRSDPTLKLVFLAANGLSAVMDLLDCPSERVLSPALDLLLVVVSHHPPALSASLSLGFIPAVLRLTRPGQHVDVRLAAAQYLEALCSQDSTLENTSSAVCHPADKGVPALISCGGLSELLRLVDEEGGRIPTAQHLALLNTAISCIWSIINYAACPPSSADSPPSLGQCLRLMAQQGAAARLVCVLPRVMQEQAAASQAARSISAARRHSRSSSVPQTEAELSLLSADCLAGPGSRHTSVQSGLAGASAENGDGDLLMGGRQSTGSNSSGQPARGAGEQTLSPQRLSRTLHPTPNGLFQKLQSAPVVPGEGSGDSPEEEAACKLEWLLEAIINLFAVMSHGDSVVKSRMCGRDTLRTIFSLSSHLDHPLRLRLVKSVHTLTTEKEVLGQLEEAEVVSWLVAQLGHRDRPSPESDVHGEALGALYNLCHLSRSRQEQAAVAGAAGMLCPLALAAPLQRPGLQAVPAPTRSLAVSTLCTLAHGGPRTLEALRAAGGVDTLLALLREEAFQQPSLEALAVWLDSDCARVEQRMMEPGSITRLVSLLPTMATAGDPQALNRLLGPLLRMLGRSPRLAAELAQNGLAPRVMELLKRPSPHTCRSLLAMLRVMYENHPRPKEFILKYRVQQTLHALAHGQSARDAVVVRSEARSLLEAFQINLVL